MSALRPAASLLLMVQLGLLGILLGLIFIGAASHTLMVVGSLALLAGAAGSLKKTYATLRSQQLTLIIERRPGKERVEPALMIESGEGRIDQLIGGGKGTGAQVRRKTVRLSGRPETQDVLAIVEAISESDRSDSRIRNQAAQPSKGDVEVSP